MNDSDRKQEADRLELVLSQAREQLEANSISDEQLREDAVETQKELWESVGTISAASDIGHLADFMQYIDAMKRQKRSHGEHERLRLKYERMLNSPYFGRIDFRQEGESAAQSYYIGLSNLIDENCRMLVCDWRAPVASLFYDFETGAAFYNCPKGVVAGSLTGKRQYKIEGGKLIYMFDSSLKIDDEILQQILSRSTENRMKAIVTSIQREQNRVIRNEAYRNLIVSGPAGSGKTSIALHRAAYLLYRHRDKIKAENVIIFSPNRIFNDYISDVLPELGEENILQTTFYEYMQAALDAHLKKESPQDRMEFILGARSWDGYERRTAAIRLKSSAAFANALERYAADVAAVEPQFTDIVFNGETVLSAAESHELYFEEYRAFPIKRRLEKLREYAKARLKRRKGARIRELAAAMLDEGVATDRAELKKRAAAIVREESEALDAVIDGMTSFDLLSAYRNLFGRLSAYLPGESARLLEDIRTDTLENLAAGQLHEEDQAPLLFLQGALGGMPKTDGIRFVIVDEAQDYTPLQYKILQRLFPNASITMLGDPDQAINPYGSLGGFERLTDIFPAQDTLRVALTKSYRSTVEIGTFAQKILGRDADGGLVERHGEEPVVRPLPDGDAVIRQIGLDLESFQKDGYRSVGILTRTKREAAEVYQALSGKEKVRAVLSENEGFSGGILVMPAYLAKGLEFDAVIIHNAGGGNFARDEERLLLYTACTRALHVLRVYYTGALSPLLKAAAVDCS